MNVDSLNLFDEEQVKEFVSSGLGPGPNRETAAVLAAARRQRHRRRITTASLVVVSLICLYVMSPLLLPAVARALTALPGVGPGLEQALKLHSLDLAYEAGLLPTLDRSVERDGVTLTVHTVYRDSHTFELLLSVSGEADFLRALSESVGPRVELSSRWWSVTSSYSNNLYDEAAGRLYVSISSWDPPPWYVRELTVSLQWMTDPAEMEKYRTAVGWEQVALSEPLTVNCPVQRTAGVNQQVIPINQTLVSGNNTVRLVSITFNPVRTLLRYTYTGNEPNLQLFDEDGERIRLYAEGGEPSAAYVNGAAMESQTVTIRFAGCREECQVEAPLQEGYAVEGMPAFRIESIEPTHQLLPWAGSAGDYYADTKVELALEESEWHLSHVDGGTVEREGDRATLLLRRQQQSPDQPLRLTFMRWAGEPQQVTVAR